METRPFALVLVLACTPTEPAGATATPADELARLCSIAEQVSARPDLDESQRGTEMARRWEQELTTPELRAMFEAMAVVAPGERVQVVRRVAAEVGVPDWRCPVVEQYYAPSK